jgi:energy-coupling factor transporter transmembrane protein EcfT
MGLVSKNDRIKKLTVFSTLMVLVFFIVISTAKTKLQWYDVPMYPFISIIIAAIIYVLFNTLKNLTVVNNIIRVNLLPFVFLFLLFITPYQKIIHSTQIDPEYPWDKDFYELGRFLKDALKETNRVNNFYLLRENHGYRPHVDFYLKIFRDRGVNFNLKDFTTLAIGDSVITVDSNIKDYLTNHYSFETLGHYNNVVKYKITSLKKP